MKVAVYAICKNESKFVDRFMDSVSEADDVFILDTGSTDDTIDKLKKRGAFVKQEIIEPFCLHYLSIRSHCKNFLLGQNKC